MRKKLTYTKADLRRELNNIPLVYYYAELLNEQQLEERTKALKELELKVAVYEKEKGLA